MLQRARSQLLEGVVVTSQDLASGAEVGTHPVTVKSFQDPSFSISGTLMITDFVQPFENPPGRIAGSVSASAGGHTASGTFDNTFCAGLLTATI